MTLDGTPGQPTPIDAALLMMRLLYGALIGSVVIYLVFVHMVARRSGTEIDASINLGLATTAAVCGLLAPLVRRMIMPARVRGTTPVDAISPRGFGRVFSAHIVGWGLCEAVAIIGTVLAFLSGDPSTMYPFAGGAVLLFFFLAPRRVDLEAVARAEAQAADQAAGRMGDSAR